LSHEEAARVRTDIMSGDRSDMPGLIRASFGLYNTLEEVDILVDALTRIARGEYQGKYQQDIASGEYTPVGWVPAFAQYFSL
jgi:hypothetical protein